MSRCSKKIDRQLDERKLRRATNQILDGGHHREVRGSRWSHVPEQTPLMDGPSNGTSKSKGKKCKRNKMGPHVPVYKKVRSWWWTTAEGERREFPSYGYVCEKCGKHLWRYRPAVIPAKPDPSQAHWTYDRIFRRLYGDGKCDCGACPSKSDVLN